MALLERIAPSADDFPIVVCPDGTVLRAPTENALATAVYAASEGLSVAVFDARAPGGQAGASARIENFLGFPMGISGQALAGLTFVQAQKFGAHLFIPSRVASIRCEGDAVALELDNGNCVRARSVVIASGASYRRPISRRTHASCEAARWS